MAMIVLRKRPHEETVRVEGVENGGDLPPGPAVCMNAFVTHVVYEFSFGPSFVVFG